jgi:prepilin-type N-terminal cleavage/methylation domain-containing protein
MKPTSASFSTATARGARAVQRKQGFSLLEMIGVMAVIAIMATLVMPSIIQQMKLAAAEQESETLQRLAKGFNDHVLRNKQIPDETDWAEVIATELGLQTEEVGVNSSHIARVYLIDPALRIGAADGTLPYTQTNSGSLVEPASSSWRLMIVSSLDPARPLPVSSGVGDATRFNNLWNAADGTVPAGWPGSWLNHGEELKIQRINLASLFKRLILTNYDSPSGGIFAMDDSDPGSIPAEGVNAFFIEGTVVSLFDGNQVVESRQLLRWPATFVYERGHWRGQIFQGLKLTDDDLYEASYFFLKSAWYDNASWGATTAAVVVAMAGYMTIFGDLSTEGVPGGGAPTRNAVQGGQAALKSASEIMIAQPAP